MRRNMGRGTGAWGRGGRWDKGDPRGVRGAAGRGLPRGLMGWDATKQPQGRRGRQAWLRTCRESREKREEKGAKRQEKGAKRQEKAVLGGGTRVRNWTRPHRRLRAPAT